MKRRGLALRGALAVLCLLGVAAGTSVPVVTAQAATAQLEATTERSESRLFKAGDTLEKLLRSTGIDKVEAARVAVALGRAVDLRELKPGHSLKLKIGSTDAGKPTLIGATLGLDEGREVLVSRDSKGLFVARKAREKSSTASESSSAASETSAEKIAATAVVEKNPAKLSEKPKARTDVVVKAPKPRAKPAAFAKLDEPAAPAAPAPATESGPEEAASKDAAPVPEIKLETAAAEPVEAPAPKGAALLKIKDGQTLAVILAKRGVKKAEAARAIEAMRDVIDLRTLQIGQEVAVATGPGGKGLERLAIRKRDGSFAEIARRPDGSFGAPEAAPAEPAIAAAGSVPSIEPERVAEPEASEKPAAELVVAAETKEIEAPAIKAPIPPAKPKAGRAPEPRDATPETEPKVEVAKAVAAVKFTDEEQTAERARAAAEMALAAKKDEVARVEREAKPVAPGIENAAREEKVTLAKGGTLHSLLKARGYQGGEVVAAARALALAVDPTTLRWGQEFKLAYAEGSKGSKTLERLTLVPKSGKTVVIGRQSDGSYAPVDELAPRPPTVAEEAAVARLQVEESDERPGDEVTEGADTAVYIEEQAAPRDTAYRLSVEPGDSLLAILLREGVDAEEIDSAVRALRKHYNPRRLREGQTLALLLDSDSSGEIHLAALAVPVGERKVIEVQRQRDGSFEANPQRKPSFADRLPPEGIYASVGGLPRNSVGTQGGAASSANQRAGSASSTVLASYDAPEDDEEGWSVMSWLGSVGEAIGRTGEAEAAIANFEPEPKRNRALDLEERPEEIDPAETMPTEEDLFREVELEKGETITTALARAGVTEGEAQAAVAALKQVHSPKRLQAGQKIAVSFEAIQIPGIAETSVEGDTVNVKLERISISVTPDRDVVVERGKGDSFRAREIERPLIRAVYKAAGEIRSSFYDSALAAGLSMDILTQMVRMFSYDVDFQRSLRDGDTFEVLYERTENDRGDSVEQATVLYAALNVSGERIELFRYEPPSGSADYYDRAGQSAKKALLRTPIDGARISSGFGMRKHPILGFTKKHKGVDFAAPHGTPVFAGGDGVIEKIGWFSSYGKYIRIKHSETYKTAYAHLRGYARGMKVGTRVRQGQVIGYVGSTGRSTGPHLHYEVLKHDKQINPNDSKSPIGKQLEGKQLAQFKSEIKSYESMYAQAETRTKVAQGETAGR